MFANDSGWHVTLFLFGSFAEVQNDCPTYVPRIPLAILSVDYHSMIMHLSIEIDSSALERSARFQFSLSNLTFDSEPPCHQPFYFPD